MGRKSTDATARARAATALVSSTHRALRMAIDPPPPRAAPTKRIISRAHLATFLDSPTHADLVAFLEELNESISTVKLSDSIPQSSVRS